MNRKTVDRPTRRVEPMWGTMISLFVLDPVDPAVIDDVFGWFQRVDDLFSTWRADSEISRIGRGELTAAHASPEVREVLALCEQMKHATCGAFDIAVGADADIEPRPGLAPLDPSGLVKGWALERAVDRLASGGVSHLALNAGGDVVVRGGVGDDRPWRIGIQHPWRHDRVADVVWVTSGAVATSGRAERGDHVIDPRSRRPAQGLMSATVVGTDLAIADALATAAVAVGSIAAPWLTGRSDTQALAITDAGAVVTTFGFDEYRSR
ncbi:MAG: FAD:protein FMN transferase [Acidimicrobiia bacterium]